VIKNKCLHFNYSCSLVSILLLIGFCHRLYAAPLELQGSLQQGGLVIGKIPIGYEVIYKQNKLKLTSSGQFLLGFGRNAPAEIKITIINSDSQRLVEVLSIASREYNIQRIQGVPQKTVTPSETDLKRIRSDIALVKNARKDITDRMDFLVGFKEPNIGPITGIYGSQRFYNGVPKSPHYGIDYAAPTGTLVKAPAGGQVTLAHKDLFYSGGTLIIDHGHGLSSTFLHLSEIVVELGQIVKPDQVIGKVGSTGRATGPHLDWRMNWRDQRIDPKLVLQALPRAN
jgi:murein DD-endopeptidase MepM/ murein hydrolase activator NlpD